MTNSTNDAIRSIGVSPNVSDTNGEAANLVDVINYAARAIAGHDRSVHAGLMAIADGLVQVANAIKEKDLYE